MRRTDLKTTDVLTPGCPQATGRVPRLPTTRSHNIIYIIFVHLTVHLYTVHFPCEVLDFHYLLHKLLLFKALQMLEHEQQIYRLLNNMKKKKRVSLIIKRQISRRPSSETEVEFWVLTQFAHVEFDLDQIHVQFTVFVSHTLIYRQACDCIYFPPLDKCSGSDTLTTLTSCEIKPCGSFGPIIRIHFWQLRDGSFGGKKSEIFVSWNKTLYHADDGSWKSSSSSHDVFKVGRC